MRNLTCCILLFTGVLIQFEAAAQCNCVENSSELSSAQLLLCENFESYTNGSAFPVNNSRWIPWPTAGTDLAKIQSNSTASDKKALYMQRNGTINPDVLLKLGNKTSGRFRLSWQMFIAKDKTAHYNIQHEENVTDGHWAFQVEFNSNGIGSVYLYSETPVSFFPYLKGAWNTVMHIVDLDDDKIELWINNEFVDAWKFSLGTKKVGQINYSSKLGAVDFYAGEGADFYVDNICLRQASKTDIIITKTPVCIKNGTSFSSSAAARHYGLYTNFEQQSGECDPICNYWGVDLKFNEVIKSEINAEDYLPNAIIGLNCLQEKFSTYSKKQLKGDVFSPRYIARQDKTVMVTLNLEEGSIEDVVVVLYDCSTKFCNEPIEVIKKNTEITFKFNHESLLGRFFIISPKKIKYSVRFSYATSILNFKCEEYPVLCNCQEAGNKSLMQDLEIGKTFNLNFSKFDYPVQTYNEFNAGSFFSGNEGVANFFIEKTSQINLQVTATLNGLGVFLYGGDCGLGPIAFSQSANNGGTASIQKVLEPGKYFLYFDLIQNKPPGTVTIKVDAQPTDVPINEGAINACPVIAAKNHQITIRSTPLFLDGNPLTLSDRILVFNENSIKQSLESKSWNGSELVLDLKFDDPNDSSVCGFQENEAINFEVIRGNQVIPVQPIFQPIDQTNINATNLFKSGGRSLITGFYARQETAHINVNSLPKLSAGSGEFLVDLSTSDDWSIVNTPQRNWVKVSPLQGEKGYSELKFTITANPFTSTRKDTVYIVDSKGNNRTIILEQPGCTGPSVNAGPDQSLCGSQTINLSAIGVGTISWRTPNGNTISGTRLSTMVTSTQIFTALATLNSCSAEDQITIIVNPNPSIKKDSSQFKAGVKSFIAVSMTGGKAPYQYQWFRNDTLTSTQEDLIGLKTGIYKLTVKDANGCSAGYGPELFIITSTRDVTGLLDLKIYPNPTQGQLRIEGRLSKKEILQVCILDATGKSIWKSEVKTTEEFLFAPNLSNLVKGIYVVQLEVSGDLVHRKLVVH